MISSGKLILIGLTLFAAAGVMLAAPTIPVSAAPAAPAVAVSAHFDTVYLPGSYDTVAIGRLTVHITGSNFTPGEKVSLAVLTSSPWAVLGRGSTRAQASVSTWICGHEHQVCSAPNPRAGTFDYSAQFNSVTAKSSLLVLYRSTHLTGLRDVTLQ